VNLTVRSTLPSPIISATARKGSNIFSKFDQRRKDTRKVNAFTVFSLKTAKKLFFGGKQGWKTNYKLVTHVFSKHRKQTAKTLRTPHVQWKTATTSGGNHRIGVTSTLKTCIPTVF